MHLGAQRTHTKSSCRAAGDDMASPPTYLGRLGEEDIDGEGPPGDLEDGDGAEEVGELGGVQCGAGHDQLEVAPVGEDMHMNM